MRNYLVALVLFVCSLNMTFAQDYYFEHYQVENGLSHNTVSSILQDNFGFMWFGTKDGLNRFDGYNFKLFQNNPKDSTSIGNNFIHALHEYDGVMWVGTDRGLYSYDAKYENFNNTFGNEAPVTEIESDEVGNLWFIARATLSKYKVETKEINTYEQAHFFEANSISASNKMVWVSSSNQIYRYLPKSNSFKKFELNLESIDEKSLLINKIFIVNNTTLLIGTQNLGVISYNIESQKSTKVFANKTQPVFVRNFVKKSENEIWIATESGVYTYNIKSGKYQVLEKKHNDPYSLSDNAVYSIAVDSDEGVWIGTYFGGVNYLAKKYTPFKKYYQKIGENSISGNAVREIQKGKFENLWIGTEDAGLNKFNIKTGVFTNYQPNKSSGSLSHYNIHALLPKGNELWIGTFERGLDIMDIKTGKIAKHFSTNEREGSLSSNFIYALHETVSKKIIILTTRGIQYYDAEHNNFKFLEGFPKNYHYTAFLEDTNCNLWAGTYRDGLYFYNPKTKEKLVFKENLQDTLSISSSSINGIFQDANKNIWVTTENGFNLYDKQNNGFQSFSTNDGFPSNVTYSILEDKQNYLWISTSKGLVEFHPNSKKIKVYTKANGILSDQFNYNSAYKDSIGNMYFGSTKGMISFNPENFKKNTFKAPMLITGLQINNQEVLVNKEKSPLKKSIILADKIKLSNQESSFNLDFAALSFSAPKMIEYWYKLEGLNDNWINLRKNHKVYFTELPPGNYNFKVKSLNSNDVWSEEASLEIEVLPGFWATNTAYFIYCALCVLLVFFGLKYYHLKNEEKNNQTIKQLNNQKEKEIYQAKIEFFTNVAHEVRTPLTLIISPLEKIINKFNHITGLHDNLSIMEKNTSRLLDLVNQLLDFRKTEMESISLTFTEVNISELTRNTFIRFSQSIKEKNLNFSLNLGQEDVYAFVDLEAIKKILSNLFNNAIKYSDKQFIINLVSHQESIELSFKNDGALIPSSIKEKIFEPFYRAPEMENQAGTGIGLSLAYSLAELHKGSLKLDTSDGKMNNFILTLPLHQEKEFKFYKNNSIDILEPNDKDTDVFNLEDESQKNTILLVEDNLDLLDFVAKDLKEQYIVFKAINAEKALQIIAEEKIQLVISDIMMPGMDGFELCKTIKTKLESSHIPIILLTAKNTMNAKIEGLESGADAYIEKPFSVEYLRIQIGNLLENRKNIMEYYSSSPLAHIRSIAHTKTDEIFIKKLDDVIFENIGNYNLSVDILAEIMNMSRSTLYRKINDLSNLSPNDLINIARLKKAAELLSTGEFKIYEVAESVGFKSQSSFGRSFSKQFKMTPTEYMNSFHISE
ncbi:hybrid sensor histidine kinase/response regulator transcription factor [Flavivirga sp. 57AJ16]|uniref:hybrid sensor histidine kinase/response regulator transcription factor n=1 Tax=Flavivirga sp. 57AJ16 TaxID=3025307 RepID=UPI002365A64A|nr:hybrid sensor histidine kinase/response regulator transcription factor [Flavivirga sp. 57AJ16]MDD7886281.1 two-component regulator propeller domain-containing protein [Flavivirga sp. 57AJ16]